MSRTLVPGIALAALCFAAAGCTQQAHVVESTANAPSAPSAPAASAPAAVPASPAPLPEGHPPIDGSSSMAIPPPPPGTGQGSTALVWQAPASWIQEEPSNSMRRAQYRVPGAGGDAECVVFYFGPGQGGAPLSNAQRWAGQFTQPDGRSPLDVMKTKEYQVGAVAVLEVEITGTYGSGSMMGSTAAAEPLKDAMLLGAVASGPDANWFFKLTGPRKTVEGARKDFASLIQSLKPGADPA